MRRRFKLRLRTIRTMRRIKGSLDNVVSHRPFTIARSTSQNKCTRQAKVAFIRSEFSYTRPTLKVVLVGRRKDETLEMFEGAASHHSHHEKPLEELATAHGATFGNNGELISDEVL
jgi:hypothetical protein